MIIFYLITGTGMYITNKTKLSMILLLLLIIERFYKSMLAYCFFFNLKNLQEISQIKLVKAKLLFSILLFSIFRFSHNFDSSENLFTKMIKLTFMPQGFLF